MFENEINKFLEFSLSTFKDATALSSLDKLFDEIDEVKQCRDINHLPEEYADCIMCLFDSAARVGIKPEQIIQAFSIKTSINKKRKWFKNPNNTYQHI